MKHKTIFVTLVIIAFALIALSGNTTPASAKPADAYTIEWYTVDGGGATFSTGDTYSLGGTIGQADAGTLSDSTYTLNGGFWNAAADLLYYYLPVILK